jgi:putative flippase GtrA
MYVLYNVLKMGYWGSSAVSYLVSSILSMVLNKNITFKNNVSYYITAPKFFINIAACYTSAFLIAKPSIKFLLSFINIDKNNVVEQVALLFGVCLFTGMNFIGQKYFVFLKKERL